MTWNTGDSYKQTSLLKSVLKHLKDNFLLRNDPVPRTVEQLMTDTFNTDMLDTMTTWLQGTLPKVDRIFSTPDGKYVYNPPLLCRDRRTFWKLMREYDKECKGMLRQDVLDSIPGKGKALEIIESYRDKLKVIGTDEKTQVLFIKDNTFVRNFKSLQGELWHSIDVSQVDERFVEAELVRAGVEVVEQKFKRTCTRLPRLKKKKDSQEFRESGPGPNKVRHIKQNSHVMSDLKDYNIEGSGKKRKPREARAINADAGNMSKALRKEDSDSDTPL